MTKRKKPEERLKMGRPTLYTEELADLICDKIASSSWGVHRICVNNADLPDSTSVYLWLNKYPDFSRKYLQAKASQAHVLADECIEIADDTSDDIKIDPETGMEVCNTDFIARARLKIDTRKWMAGRLAPKIYGKLAEEPSKEKDGAETLLEKLLDKLVDK